MLRSLAEHGTETQFDLPPRLIEAIGVQKLRIGVAQLGYGKVPEYLARATSARLTFLERADAKVARKAAQEPLLVLAPFAVQFLKLVKDLLCRGGARNSFARGDRHAVGDEPGFEMRHRRQQRHQ